MADGSRRGEFVRWRRWLIDDRPRIARIWLIVDPAKPILVTSTHDNDTRRDRDCSAGRNPICHQHGRRKIVSNANRKIALGTSRVVVLDDRDLPHIPSNVDHDGSQLSAEGKWLGLIDRRNFGLPVAAVCDASARCSRLVRRRTDSSRGELRPRRLFPRSL